MKKKFNFKRVAAYCMILVLAITGTTGCGLKKEELLEEIELTDTVRWFNATYAILTETNNWDYNLFGGLTNTEKNRKDVRKLLNERWGVTDWNSADINLETIRDKGLLRSNLSGSRNFT